MQANTLYSLARVYAVEGEVLPLQHQLLVVAHVLELGGPLRDAVLPPIVLRGSDVKVHKIPHTVFRSEKKSS